MPTEEQFSRYWVHNLDSFIIKFPEGFFLEGIKWYGLAYVLGFVSAGFLLNRYFKYNRSPLNTDAQTNLLTAIMIGTILGGRIGYMLLYQWQDFIQNPAIIFRIWEGGMASHGGFVGVCLAVIAFAKFTQNNFWQIADITVTLAPPGLFLGRIANFVNAELWGNVTDVRWAVIFPYPTIEGIAYTLPRHPSQIYEALLEGLVLFAFIQFRFWKRSKNVLRYGKITAEFLIAYSILRIIGEQFRTPDEGISLIVGMSRGVFYSLVLLFVGLFLLIVKSRNKKEENTSQ